MAADIEWHTEQRKLSDLAEWPKNPRQLSDHDAEEIKRSIARFGLADPLVVNANDQIIGGHQRKRIMLLMECYGHDALVDVRIPSRELTEKEAEELGIRLNRNLGEFDFDVLANEFDLDDLLDWGFEEDELLGLDYENPRLRETVVPLESREMMRILVSIPLDEAINARSLCEVLAAIPGSEVDYGSN